MEEQKRHADRDGILLPDCAHSCTATARQPNHTFVSRQDFSLDSSDAVYEIQATIDVQALPDKTILSDGEE